MITLPYSPKLNISALAAVFDETTNSYKYYWFLAILDLIREGWEEVIPSNRLVAYMLANAWYPSVYFMLSFGTQDQMDKAISLVRTHCGLVPNAPRQQIIECVLDHLNQRDDTSRTIYSLLNFVPYRFLRPFFAQTLRGAKDWVVNRRIRALAEASYTDASPCMYRFIAEPVNGIKLHPAWVDYIKQHLHILTGFCLWRLIHYLQRNNPNVPNIAYKLFEPQARDLRIARDFWAFVIAQAGPLHCIYSGMKIPSDGFSLDHFLPWRYVAHDGLWNLVPTLKAVNTSKRDSIPDFVYFEPFASLQYCAVQIAVHSPRRAWLDDYLLLFRVDRAVQLQHLNFDTFRETLRRTLLPQIEIAANMGFVTGWRYGVPSETLAS